MASLPETRLSSGSAAAGLEKVAAGKKSGFHLFPLALELYFGKFVTSMSP
jgi:hypothetical protein